MSDTFPILPNDRRTIITASAGQTVLAFDFPIQVDDDLRVLRIRAGVHALLDLTSHYSVSGAGDAAGGAVTLMSGALAGDVYRLEGAAVLERVTSIVRAGRFASLPQDAEHDRHRLIQQELRRDVDQAVSVEPGLPALRLTESLVEGATIVKGPGDTLIQGPDLVAVAASGAEAIAARDAILGYVPSPGSWSLPGNGVGPYNLGVAIGSIQALDVCLNGRTLPFTKYYLTPAGTGFMLQGLSGYPTSDDVVHGTLHSIKVLSQSGVHTVNDAAIDPTSRLGDLLVTYPHVLRRYDIADDGDQSENFAVLEADIAGLEIDLEGEAFDVDAVPTGNRYKNGSFRRRSVGIPQKDALRGRSFRLTKTNRYSKWAQDKAHVDRRGNVHVPYVEGARHQDPANMVLLKSSYDGGATFGPPEVIYNPVTGRLPAATHTDSFVSCMAAIVNGENRQVFWFTTYEDARRRNFIHHRKLQDYQKIIGATLTTTAGSNIIKITAVGSLHGFHAADKFHFTRLDAGATNLLAAPVNGVTIADDNVTTASTLGTWSFAGTGNASVTQDIGVDIYVSNEICPFVEVEITALMDTLYSVFETPPAAGFNYHHSAAYDPVTNTIYSTISTGTVGSIVMKYTNLRVISTASVSMTAMGFSGGEATLGLMSSGVFVGFTRGDDFAGGTTRSRFWITRDDFGSTDWEYVRPADTLAGQIWDEPTPLVVANGMVYAARCERTDDPLAVIQTGQASMKIYLLQASVADVLADGMAAFKFTEMGRALWSGAKSGQGGPGVGVGSWVEIPPLPEAQHVAATGYTQRYSRLMYFYGSEQENMTGDRFDWTQGQIYAIEILDPRAPYYAVDNGAGVEGGRSESVQAKLYERSDALNTGWSVSKGSYTTTDPPVTPVDLTNSADYKGGGVRLYRELTGMVTMFGRIDASGVAVNPVMTLPHGWRPAFDVQVITIGGAAKQDRAGGLALVVTIFGANNASVARRGMIFVTRIAADDLGGAVSDISLDGIRFPADGDAR